MTPTPAVTSLFCPMAIATVTAIIASAPPDERGPSARGPIYPAGRLLRARCLRIGVPTFGV